jgi:membrane-bound lytic murein transglycosylase F
VVLLSGLLAACERSGPSILEQIQQQGSLVVLTRNAPTTYYHDRDGETGFEYELTQRLAESLGVEAEYKVYDTIGAILQAIKAGEGHIAAAGLTRTEAREAQFRFGPAYKTVQQQVVCHRRGKVPTDVASLTEVKLEIIAASSYQERLEELQADYPRLRWNTSDQLATEQILERVWQREVDCAVADSNIVAINRRYYPELVIGFPLSEEQQLAWILPDTAEKLQSYLEKWFENVKNQGFLAELNERFYGHVNIFDFVDTRAYLRRIRTRLPRYQDSFKKAAQRYGLSWTLLAAQAYQESHWNRRSKSPTGVRGIMMLTLPTARAVGVKNRLDAEQSIGGGAKYLARLLKRQPKSIPPSDRLWFALTAYNVGSGHLADARLLAARLGKNPDAWHDVQSVLPLLSQKRHYRTLKHGYARGTEPVRYVQRVRDYRDILERHVTLAQAAAAAPLQP